MCLLDPFDNILKNENMGLKNTCIHLNAVGTLIETIDPLLSFIEIIMIANGILYIMYLEHILFDRVCLIDEKKKTKSASWKE